METAVTGPGELNISWKVSSEANHDYLCFYIDSVQQDAISCEAGWQQKTFIVSSGPHTLRWNYTKDNNVSSGIDASWLDKVEFTLIPPPSATDSTVSHEIPDDTDNNPLWGETARLNVTVSGKIRLASVTVNLSEIGGPNAKPMANIMDNFWSTTINASSGTPPNTYYLTVNATDINGFSNTSVKIPLIVLKNGDTTGNGLVNEDDALRLANNISHPGNPAYYLSSIYVADVTGNGMINIVYALRLENNVSHPGNPLYTLK